MIGVLAPDFKWASDWARREGLTRDSWQYIVEPANLFGFTGKIYVLGVPGVGSFSEWRDILASMEARGSITVTYP